MQAAAIVKGVGCFPSGWCDLSREHERIRTEIESMIEGYVRGSGSEYYMPVIVAPYGSGKTALLRHLEWYSREKLGVNAARVEFADIVDFIVEKHGSIHEHMLPRVLEEYVAERHGAREGFFVLLVDEVEESYDVFRGVVEHETSPLRGLAEAVRTRSTRVYPVLALGPSSTLKEAVFGPVAWRSRVFTIPLLPRSAILAEARRLVDDERLAELLANMAWWASKGRVAWARLVLESTLPRLVEALGSGPEVVEAVLLGDEALSREILDGVPMLDRRGYRELKRFLPEKRLAPLLAVLPGPAPVGLVEKLMGSPLLPEPSPVAGFSRSGVDVDALIEAAMQWMERVSRVKGFPDHSVDHAVSMLEHVLHALSLGGVVPYDQEFLAQAFSLAADLAREVYSDDPAAAYMLETLRPDMIAPEPRRLGEPVVYAKPHVLARIYPVAGSSPLVGCARRAGPGQVVEVVESLAPEEIEEYMSRAKQLLGLSEIEEKHGVSVALVPAPALSSMAERLACEAARRGVIIVTAEPRDEAEARTPEALRLLEKLGLAAVTAAGPRLSMFIYSVYYNLALGVPGCSLEKLPPSDARAMHVYGELLKSLVLDAAAQRRGAELRGEIAAVEKLLGGEAAALLARLAASKGPGALREAAGLLREAAGLAAELARVAGAEAPRLPDPSAVERLAAILEEVGVPLRGLAGCGGVSTGSPVIDALLSRNRVETVEEVASKLAELEKIAAAVPVGPGARIAEALARLRASVSRPGGAVVAATLAPLLAVVEARLGTVARLYGEARSMLASVPGAGEALLEALHHDLEAAETLAEEEELLAKALALAPKIEELRRSASVLTRLEEEKKKLIEYIDSVFGAPEPQGTGAAEEAKAPA